MADKVGDILEVFGWRKYKPAEQRQQYIHEERQEQGLPIGKCPVCQARAMVELKDGVMCQRCGFLATWRERVPFRRQKGKSGEEVILGELQALFPLMSALGLAGMILFFLY